ncbi:uncharacterized protein [Oryza sativa Japonica Group]|uniref:Expressed protein n=2 Tax=Oryza sativa subsp. japonica TaxID=39947 RepID=Q338Z9_ORYSJ|nr:uncharacterized protein LOC9270624 [Oryza sativa Japonica Group]KAB8112545.1 hypothetical protein EE612_051023 [Oryza sativa]ABB47383.1 expressed protein [Oryza sativa Japonica Group]KAF2913346.1 hypothetical protein DAI22_10g077300 [Oryza sativa Japonica Group]BAG99226.1 unnamed protein product [Oryza sativa Japonica Group]BAH94852.1 Os10g0377000 [Oryza sativa Japonica Group]|eukprot:NP_001176124.1 Os10g0377000 [Oryza sativa Japonica Group]
MSALVRSVASLYCQGLRRTVRLGGGATAGTPAARAPALDQRRPFLSRVDRIEATTGGGGGGAADTGGSPRRHGKEGTAPLFTWARLVVVLAAMAPFLQSKWATLLRIQSEVEMVKDAAETAAEVVEEVAAAVEKASAEVAEAEQLPEHGALRRAAALVERASREVAEEAHLAHDIIHKVDEIEEDVKTMIEPIIDNHKHGTRGTIKKH